MKFIIAKKIEMTQVWQGDAVVAVTKVQAGPCQITQLKSVDTDGYEAVQIGFGVRKTKNIRKPQIGHYKKANVDTDSKTTLHHTREFRGEDVCKGLELGDVVKADTFAAGDKIQITGVSKGRGFQGVVKRHHFHGTNDQHGNKDQTRMPGSIGATGPAHVFKGTKMGGRMGNDQVTMRTLEIVDVDNESGIILIKGGLPGARNGLILICGDGELKVSKPEVRIAKKTEAKKAIDKPAEDKVESKKEVKTETKKTVAKKEDVETPAQVEKEVVEAKEKVEKEKVEKKD